MNFNKLLKNNIVVLLLRMLIVVGVVWLLRVVFYVGNMDYIGSLSWVEIPSLIRGSLIFDASNLAFTFGMFVVLSLLPFKFRSGKVYQKVLFWYFVVGIVVLVFLNLSDTVYFRYTHKRATVAEFSYVSNDNTLLVMMKAALENWYLVIFGALLVWGALFLYNRIKINPKDENVAGVRYYMINSCVFLLSVFLLIVGMRGGVTSAIRPIAMGGAAHFVTTPVKANIVLSNPFCIIRTMGNKKIRYTKYFEKEKLDSIYSPIHSGVDSAEIVKKNVVILVLESFSYEHSAYLNPELYPDGVGYTPFLDSLMQHGYIFDKCYANAGKSIDALPAILTSIPSLKTPFALMPQALSPMRGLGTLLGEEGWERWFFNGSEERSMGFVAYAKSAGFENIRTKENYEVSRGNNDYDGTWGIWDEPFLNYMASELNQAKEPFISTVFTLSSHHPFAIPKEYKDVLPKGKIKLQQPIAYADLALRKFFETAQKNDWYKNSIFVVIADHTSSEIYAKNPTPAERIQIMYFIYTPDGSLKGRSDRVTQHIDLMPTVLGLLGYNKPYFAFGQDHFSEKNKGGFAIHHTDGSFLWVNDKGYYLFDEVTTGDDEVDDQVKAFVQSYYENVEQGKFVVDPIK